MKKSLLVGLVVGFSSLSVLGSEVPSREGSSDDKQCVSLYLHVMSLSTWPTNRLAMRKQYRHCQQARIFNRVAQLACENKNFEVVDRAIMERSDLEHPLQRELHMLPGRTQEAAINGILGGVGGFALGFAFGALFQSKR